MASQVVGPRADEASPGQAVALLALAPLASREADAREREEAEAETEGRLARELSALPELTLPPRPQAPPASGFSFDVLINVVFWGEVASIFFVGPFLLGPLVFDRKFTEAGYPWALLLVGPLVIAVLAGFLPVIAAAPLHARYREEMAAYEKAVDDAARREAQRAAVRARYGKGVE